MTQADSDFAQVAAELGVSTEELRETARWVMSPDRRRSTITVRASNGSGYGPRSDSLLYRLAAELEVEPSHLRDVILRVKRPAPGRVATIAFTHIWGSRSPARSPTDVVSTRQAQHPGGNDHVGCGHGRPGGRPRG